MSFKSLVVILVMYSQVFIHECSTSFDKEHLRTYLIESGRTAPRNRVRRLLSNWSSWDGALCEADGRCYSGRIGCYICSESTASSGCFPASAIVHLENEKTKTMAELRIGDKVKTISSDGRVTHSEVKAFMKKQLTMTTVYKSIATSDNNTISLTEDHLIYARKSSTSKFKIIYADDVSTGDEILVQGRDQMFPSKVISVSKLVMHGAYTPVTLEGNIIVDGILASCYAFPDHNLAHLAMTPMRWFPEIIKSIFGVEKGLSGYVKVAEEFKDWLFPFDFLY